MPAPTVTALVNPPSLSNPTGFAAAADAFVAAQITFQSEVNAFGAYLNSISAVSASGQFSDGTAALPALAFVLDTDTGIWRPVADTVAVSTAGVERVRVDSTGRVGIGTAAPATLAHLRSTSTIMRMEDSDGVLAGAMASLVEFYAGASRHGYVGFNTTTAGTMEVTNDQGHLAIKADNNNLHAGTIIQFVVDAAEVARMSSTGLGIGGAPLASGMLTVTSTTQGFLPPRMTTAQRDAIAAPAAGLIIYNTTTNKLNVRAAAAWEAITSV